MRIGIAYSLKPEGAAPVGLDDRFEEFDRPETVEAIAEVIRSEGHVVVPLGDGRPFLTAVLADAPDFVFNFAEGSGVSRNREARVPAVLEMLGIPYSGSDPLTLSTCLDKGLTRTIAAAAGVRLPAGQAVPLHASSRDVETLYDRLHESGVDRFIVKPSFEGSSRGIREHNLVGSLEALQREVELIRLHYGQPALVEEYIDGDEVTVGLCGHSLNVEDLGVMRILPASRDAPFVYSLEVKRDWERRVVYETPARLDAATTARITADARLAFAALGCRDVARLDFRIRDGLPYFLEANPLPGLAPVTSDLVILAAGYGLSHADLIRRILDSALERNSLMAGDGVQTV